MKKKNQREVDSIKRQMGYDIPEFGTREHKVAREYQWGIWIKRDGSRNPKTLIAFGEAGRNKDAKQAAIDTINKLRQLMNRGGIIYSYKVERVSINE